jgi:hypothetical protein
MHSHRETWRTLERTAPVVLESYWWGSLYDTYAASQAMALRRQTDTHRDVASLGKLIHDRQPVRLAAGVP